MKIPFNIPYLTGNEKSYLNYVVDHSNDNDYQSFSDKCKTYLKGKFKDSEISLTTSCTAALEISALLLDIKPGDEVIVPSFTFPSTANAFIRQGAKIVFADSRSDYPGVDENNIESLINENTKAIVPVHYAGISCDMDKIMYIAEKYRLFVIEDAALAFGSYYRSKPLGSIGHLGCISFHQSKNLQCGEGGALIVNDKKLTKRILDILEKGTNRSEFISGKVTRYEWTEIGSSYLMTELHAAYLSTQLENADLIKKNRLSLWNLYYRSFKILEGKGFVKLPVVPEYANHNAHTFYLILNNKKNKTKLMSFLNSNNIKATVHYTSLDQSIFWKRNHNLVLENINSILYNDCLLRLPLYNTMTRDEIEYVISNVLQYFIK